MRICSFLGCLLLAWTMVCADQSIDVDIQLDRATYYRGERIPVCVVWKNLRGEQVDNLVLRLDVDGILSRDLPAAGVNAAGYGGGVFRIDSDLLRVGDYQMVVTALMDGEVIGEAAATIAVAPRPNPDRMPVWLWPHQAYLDQLTPFDEESSQTLDWWSSHGFTEMALGEHISDDMIVGIEYMMKQGLNVCIMPNGGLRVAAGFNSEDDDAWFKINGGDYLTEGDGDKRILNPFHPEVAAWQDGENEAFMKQVATYPNIKTAFLNTEIVDLLRINYNEHGRRTMAETLGFTPRDVGDPNYIAPGVVADDDRLYRLLKYKFKGGNGLATANKRAADMIHRYRPDVLTINDPYREYTLLDGFPGIDIIGSWTYTNPDPKLMLYTETLQAACRYTDHTPLSVVTLLNYPGELVPNEAWTMMGPGRLAVTTWINLSRAPKMLGYYFSSAGDPFASLEDDLVTPKKDVSEEALPTATYDMMQRLSEEVIKPYGGLIRKLDLAPRRIAVLSSAASELYGSDIRLLGYYPNMQIYHFYSVLAMAHLSADVLFDEHVTRYGLDDYDVLVLPRCGILTYSVYTEVIKFQERGGLVIADQYLGPEIPGVIKFDFNFSYRKHVTALAISEGRGYVGWDDHLQPDMAEFATVKGVSALEDQRIMESYALSLRDALDGRVSRAVDCDSPTTLLSMLEGHGGNYLVAVNDKRVYDERVGKYRAVLGEVATQDVVVTLHDWRHDALIAYDMLKRQALDVKVEDGKYSFKLNLTDLGGTIVAFYARPIKSVSVTTPQRVRRGQRAGIAIRMTDSQGQPTAGVQPVRLVVRDSRSGIHEVSDYYYLESGYAVIDFMPALNDAMGEWAVEVEDLTAGNKAVADFEVIDRLP